MAHIVFFEKPGCGGNARQKQMLQAAGHTLDVRNLLATEWTMERLMAFLAPLPVPEWFNRAAPRVKSGEIDPEAVDADTAMALLLDEPLLIRRPLMACGAVRLVGFDPARVDQTWGLTPEAAALNASKAEGCAAALPGTHDTRCRPT